MKNRLLSAFALIGLMLFSTLGSLAFSPTLSTTSRTELVVTVKTVKSQLSSVDVFFLKPDDCWRSSECVRYIDPTNDGKYDNRPINGILQEHKRKQFRYLTT